MLYTKGALGALSFFVLLIIYATNAATGTISRHLTTARSRLMLITQRLIPTTQRLIPITQGLIPITRHFTKLSP